MSIPLKATLEPPRDSHTHQSRSPILTRIFRLVEDGLCDTNWTHLGFKSCAYTYILFILWITWQVLPLPGHWETSPPSDKIPGFYQDFSKKVFAHLINSHTDTCSYFGSFRGFAECGIRAINLYHLPPQDLHGHYAPNAFCPTRKVLLEAMSNGGRIGFDAPYYPKDCQYRWYSIAEICMILERFGTLVFVGDFTLQTVYNGFNILLRQDLELGAIKSWTVDLATREICRCDSQFVKATCSPHFVTASDEVVKNTPAQGSAYICPRTSHSMLRIDTSPASVSTIERFKQVVPRAPRSNYRPIPVIHSLSPSTVSQKVAAKSLLEFLKLADDSKRKTPMLWIGPTAAGHVDIKNRRGNQEIWDFDRDMAKTARDNDIEVLKMWNMTIQANSYDGLRFGEKVAITQAMMVINWLSRLESS